MITIETLNQLKFTRIYTLGRLVKTRAEAWDAQPKGFNNTVRWNVGHIFVTMETLIQKAVGDYEPVHPEWIPFFVSGSSPDDWEGNVPSTDELLVALEEQPERIIKAIEGKPSDALQEPMSIGPLHTMVTIDAVVQFAIWHEGVHAGMINALNHLTGD
ncbi:DinB family protein [Sporosarcina sp. JAI121]|uniref:DinB family protein n=1 Tax=Sporosarcina sp. JAI121 TaxID=2723064 RepID=UPI001852A278|nr:DinB family protein [Sporosarcina sp. JAI121]NYF23290.1 hypothetical protein [Sporosarcina sp. JAI121]